MPATATRLPVSPTPISCRYLPFQCDSASVAESAALVVGAGDDRVALPSAGEVGAFVGLALRAGSASTGAPLDVVIEGFYSGTASGTITRGDTLVIADNAGKVKTTTSVTSTAASIVGIALESATNGQPVLIHIAPAGSVFGNDAAGSVLTAGSGGVTAGAAVVQDSANDRKVILPAAADPRSGVVGIALSTAAAAATVMVTTQGVASAVASGSITRGDLVSIADNTGKVKSANPLTLAAGTQIVGQALSSATNGNAVWLDVQPRTIQTGIVLPFVVGTGGVTANAIVVLDTTADRQVVLPAGADPTSGVLGVALNTALAAATAYVVVSGIATIKAKGDITRGNAVAVAEAVGTGKPAAPGAGVNTMLAGTAIDSIADGATGLILVAPSILNGAGLA